MFNNTTGITDHFQMTRLKHRKVHETRDIHMCMLRIIYSMPDICVYIQEIWAKNMLVDKGQ